MELGTAYSELTDPIEQHRRLTEQSILAVGGDPEAMELDEDFLTAMEYAKPPSHRSCFFWHSPGIVPLGH